MFTPWYNCRYLHTEWNSRPLIKAPTPLVFAPIFGLRPKAKDPKNYLSCCCSCFNRRQYGLVKEVKVAAALPYLLRLVEVVGGVGEAERLVDAELLAQQQEVTRLFRFRQPLKLLKLPLVLEDQRVTLVSKLRIFALRYKTMYANQIFGFL